MKESEERYDQLARQSGTVIWEVDTAGLYTYISPACEAIFGYLPDEMVGRMHFYNLHPETGRDEYQAACS